MLKTTGLILIGCGWIAYSAGQPKFFVRLLRARSAALAALFALFALIASGPVFAVEGAPRTGNVEKKEYVCMMQDMVMMRKGVLLVKDGKQYWGCCEMCKAKLEAEPEKYSKGIDPVSGKAVDKALALIYALEGQAFYFESKKTRAAFAKSPKKYLPAAASSELSN